LEWVRGRRRRVEEGYIQADPGEEERRWKKGSQPAAAKHSQTEFAGKTLLIAN
jgi:hypothetical protein